jgi:TatD DNase family protein
VLVDTHCHLADAAFAGAVGAVVTRAAEAGVGHIVVIGETPDRAADALRLAASDARLSATAGLHPHEARLWSPEVAAWLETAARDPRVVAVGETGLDYHYDHSPRDRQREAFDAQLDLARRVGKPAVIHARRADDDIAAVLRNHPGVVAVMHSFSSGEALLDAALALGHYVSLSGMITFKSWALAEAVARVPADRLLIETDAPYLAPVPYRGKRNEPALLALTAARLATVLDRSLAEITALTTSNAVRVFGSRLAPPAPPAPASRRPV